MSSSTAKTGEDTGIRAKFREVLRLNANLVPVAAACREVGLAYRTFWYLKREAEKGAEESDSLSAAPEQTASPSAPDEKDA